MRNQFVYCQENKSNIVVTKIDVNTYRNLLINKFKYKC